METVSAGLGKHSSLEWLAWCLSDKFAGGTGLQLSVTSEQAGICTHSEKTKVGFTLCLLSLKNCFGICNFTLCRLSCTH